MSKKHSTKPVRPAKPSPNFPLTPHPTGRWCKKIRGQLHYFGYWRGEGIGDDHGAAAALQSYKDQAEALHAGKKPRDEEESAGFTIKNLCDRFLSGKEDRMHAGELSPRTFADYHKTTDLVVSHFGRGRLLSDIGPDDFAALWKKMAKKWGPVTLGNTIQRIRVVFKYAHDAGLIDRPIRYGPDFKRPSKKTLRLDRNRQGKKLFSAEEIQRMLGCCPWRPASDQLAAMILLGINAGLGNADCGNLPLAALDLDNAIIDYPRVKTGIQRRCPLWPETVQALRSVLARRKEGNADAAGLVFVTKYGEPWAKDIADSPITKEMRKLLNRLGINSHRNFYTLRHTFRTVADAAKDQPAADHIMGHESAHMSNVYRETIADERLRAVAEHVRTWLFGAAV